MYVKILLKNKEVNDKLKNIFVICISKDEYIYNEMILKLVFK